MGGLGVEVAKNIILAGVKSVILYEYERSSTVKFEDLSAQFYLSESDVVAKRKRSEVSLSKLKELNPYVSVNIMKGELQVFLSAVHRDSQMPYNELYCRT